MTEIVTTFLGPTNTKGDRVKAAIGNAYTITGYDYALSALENHAQAARQAAMVFGLDPATVSIIDATPKKGYRFEVRKVKKK